MQKGYWPLILNKYKSNVRDLNVNINLEVFLKNSQNLAQFTVH